jgi:hypothetical protein
VRWQGGTGALVLVLVGYGWAYGACDAALLQKLLARDFTRAEILQLCGSGPPAPPPTGRHEAPEVSGPPAPPASPPDMPQEGIAAPTSQSTPEFRHPVAPGAPALPPGGAPETTDHDPGPQQTQRRSAETEARSQRALTVYQDRLIGTRSIRAARLQVAPATQQVRVEIEIFERAGAESAREYTTTPAVPHLAYDPANRTILYTGGDDAPPMVCGQMVTRRAVLGVWEDVVLTDNCRLECTTTATGRGVGRRTYGTVVLHVRDQYR